MLSRVLRRIALWLSFVSLLPIGLNATPQSSDIDPLALGLLRGVEAARTINEPVKARYRVELSVPIEASFEFLVEIDGTRARYEKLPGGTYQPDVLLKLGDLYYGYRRVKYNAVEVFPENLRAWFRIDPQVVGLPALLPSGPLRLCLQYENAASIANAGQEDVHGVSCQRVAVRFDGDLTSTYWIADDFRVYRRTTISDDGDYYDFVESEYLSTDLPVAFPSKTIMEKRWQGESRQAMVVHLLSLEIGASFPEERFTLRSFDLPLNTSVIDYRTNTHLGFWNGMDVAKERVRAPVTAAERVTARTATRWYWLVGLCLLLVLSAVFVWRRTAKSRV